MKERDILRFAKENGYDGIEPLGTWRGFDVYEPVCDTTNEEAPAMAGPPLVILVQGDTVRMSTEEEAYQQLDES